MKAMVLDRPAPIDSAPLSLREVPTPEPGPGEIRLRVRACGICRTDLHVVEGELPPRRHTVIPGHQVVGVVDACGTGAARFRPGDAVGVAWLRSTCGRCRYCAAGRENLCPDARFTGYDADGGYAEFAVVRDDFAYPLPPSLDPVAAAPLLCAGIIGYRALRRAEVRPGCRLGLYGFGSSAHICIQVARHWGCTVHVMTRDARHRELARRLGAAWAGGAAERPPEPLDSAILFAPAGDLVPAALEALDKGGTLAVAGIYLSQVPPLDYQRHLFHEKPVRSVTANTRQDGAELMRLAADVPLKPRVTTFPIDRANDALRQLKHDAIDGSGVLVLPPQPAPAGAATGAP
jgi:propanol-preferring alcohol dehydrogenase